MTEERKAEAPASAKPTAPAAGPGGSSKILKEGDKLPKIKLENQEGDEVDVSSLAGEKGVVIFLYPKVSTSPFPPSPLGMGFSRGRRPWSTAT